MDAVFAFAVGLRRVFFESMTAVPSLFTRDVVCNALSNVLKRCNRHAVPAGLVSAAHS